VTIDTEVPFSIPKEQRKKQPSKQEFDKKLTDLDHQIEALKGKIVCYLYYLISYIGYLISQKERYQRRRKSRKYQHDLQRSTRQKD
jgi:hypothetical protein